MDVPVGGDISVNVAVAGMGVWKSVGVDDGLAVTVIASIGALRVTVTVEVAGSGIDAAVGVFNGDGAGLEQAVSVSKMARKMLKTGFMMGFMLKARGYSKACFNLSATVRKTFMRE